MSTNMVSRYVVRQGNPRPGNLVPKEPSIFGTKVTVRDIAEIWRSGVTPEKIPEQLFNLITLAQVFDALSFYLDNQAEIDGYIEWYKHHPTLNIPVRLRLNPLRDEVEGEIDRNRQVSDWPEQQIAS